MQAVIEKTYMSPAALNEPKRILAIDYGKKRIGLALSDELGVTASPLTVLVRRNRQDDLKRLRELCKQNSIGRIIVGNPLHITGEAGEMAEEAARFASRLEKALGIDVELVDERLTTWEARQTISHAAVGKGKKRTMIDDVAAAVLLRDYLAQRQGANLTSQTERD